MYAETYINIRAIEAFTVYFDYEQYCSKQQTEMNTWRMNTFAAPSARHILVIGLLTVIEYRKLLRRVSSKVTYFTPV